MDTGFRYAQSLDTALVHFSERSGISALDVTLTELESNSLELEPSEILEQIRSLRRQHLQVRKRVEQQIVSIEERDSFFRKWPYFLIIFFYVCFSARKELNARKRSQALELEQQDLEIILSRAEQLRDSIQTKVNLALRE